LQNESESKSVEDHLSTATKLLPAKVVSRKTTTFPKKTTTIQEKVDCEENPLDPACLTQKYNTSLEELIIEVLTTTETAAIAETSSISKRNNLERGDISSFY